MQLIRDNSHMLLGLNFLTFVFKPKKAFAQCLNSSLKAAQVVKL